MKKVKKTKTALTLVAMFTLIGTFQNCGFIQRPQMPEQSAMFSSSVHSSASFQSMQCMDCHEGDRKAPDHYAGQDCKGCHVPGATWAQGATTAHTPTPTQCNSCHAPGAPYNKFPANHYNVGTADCIQCHQPSIANGFIDFKGAIQEHTAAIIAAKNCASCHAVDRPPTVALTNINPSINSVPDKTHFAAKDCYECHNVAPAAQGWRGTTAGRYEHQNAAGGNINFCLSCHIRDEHVGQDGSVANDIVGDGKCQQCHQRPRSWSDSNRNPNL